MDERNERGYWIGCADDTLRDLTAIDGATMLDLSIDAFGGDSRIIDDPLSGSCGISGELR